MNREQLIAEIERVEKAIKKTDSDRLKRDYRKHLRRMKCELHYFDMQMRQWQMKRT